MKTIGLVGGITWVSTIEYYRYLNEGIHAALGGHHYCRCLINALDFQDIQDLKARDDWEGTLRLLVAAAQTLEKAGAELLMIGANTMHFAADRIQSEVGIPLIHIAEATGSAIQAAGLSHVALLGTRFTMEMAFYKEKLARQSISTTIPEVHERDFIHDSIYSELCFGTVKPETKAQYIAVIERLAASGAQGVILGCTEIPLVIQPGDVSIPVFDTTKIHAAAAVAYALG